MRANLSPAFCFVADAKKVYPAPWQVLESIVRSTGQLFIRHAPRKPGHSLTVYDPAAHLIQRCALDGGVLSMLSAIERKTAGRVRVLRSGEYVAADRKTVFNADSVATGADPAVETVTVCNPGLTD